MKKKYIENLQSIRALAAILVLLDHVFSLAFINNVKPESNAIITSFFYGIGNIGVCIFFILSGYLMIETCGKKNSYQFIVDRMIRIYPCYLILSLPAIIYLCCKNYFGMDSLLQFTSNLNLLPFRFENFQLANYPAWTLVYEIFFYIIFSIAIFFTKNKTKLSISVAISISLIYLLINFFSKEIKNPTGIDIFNIAKNNIIFYFVIGCLIPLFTKGIKGGEGRLRFNFIPVSVLSIFLLPIIHITLGVSYYFFLEMTLTTSIIVLAIACKSKNNKAIELIGDSSYSIYLFHPCILVALQHLGQVIGIRSTQLTIIYGLISLLICVFSGIIAHNKIERKVQNYINSKKKHIPMYLK